MDKDGACTVFIVFYQPDNQLDKKFLKIFLKNTCGLKKRLYFCTRK